MIVRFYLRFDVYDNAIGPTMCYVTQTSGEKNDIIFIGNSRIQKSTNPVIIQSATGLKAYNLALDGSSIVHFNMVFRRYIETHPKPDYLFINADFVGYDPGFLVYNYPDYFPFLDDPTVDTLLTPYCSYYASDKAWGRWYDRIRMINSKPDKQKLDAIGNIFSGEARRTAADRSLKGFMPSYDHWGDFPVDTSRHHIVAYHQKGFDILQGIIKDCKKDSIRIILLATPMYRNYKVYIDNTQQYVDTMKSLSSRYNIPFWNYMDIKDMDDTRYYYNIEHLNADGANVFSRILGNDIKRYLADSTYKPQIISWSE